MQVIQGPELLRVLLNYVNENEKRLAQGSKFPLNPGSLNYLNSFLKNVEQGTDRQLKGKISHDDLIDLKYSLHQLIALRLEPATREIIRTTELDLSLFASLKILEIHRCKPHLITNLETLSHQLEELTVTDSMNSLSEVLDIESQDPNHQVGAITQINSGAAPWSKLKMLDCSHNNIPSIDPSMWHCIAVKMVNLSHNLLTRIQNFEYCYNLTFLDLSYNQITSTKGINGVLGNLKILILRNNRLTTTVDLDKLYALEVLDLSENSISTAEEVFRFQNMPFLEKISFVGNPISFATDYRVLVLSLFPEKVVVDGKPAGPGEIHRRRSLDVQGSMSMISPLTMSSNMPKGKPKRKSKKRVANIEEDATKGQNIPGSPHFSAPPEDPDHFQKKIESMHKEGGERWLVILSELEKDEQKKLEKKVEEENIRKKDRRTRRLNEEERAKLAREKSLVIGSRSARKSPDQSSSVMIPENPNSENREPQKSESPSEDRTQNSSRDSSYDVQVEASTRLRAGSSFESRDRSASLESVKDRYPSDDEAEPTEDFFVETFNLKNELEERIVILTKDTLTEADVITGINVVQLPLKQLVRIQLVPRVEDVHFGKPEVQLVFQYRMSDRTNNTLCRYIHESQPSADKFVDILGPVVEQNMRIKMASKVKCLTCGILLAGNVEKCTKCGGEYIVEYHEPIVMPEPKPEKTAPAADTSKTPIVREVRSVSFSQGSEMKKDEYDITEDMSMQIYLRMQFFKGGSSEKPMSLFNTSFLRMATPLEEEKDCMVLLTNMYLYILIQVKKPTEKDKGMGLIDMHPLNHIKAIQIGLFYQFFSIDINGSPQYVFVTRDHTKTHRFVDLANSTIREETNNLEPVQIFNHNKSHLSSLSNILFSGKPIHLELYLLVFERSKVGRSFLKKGLQVAPRTLILTNKKIVLCDEDHYKYPFLADPNRNPSITFRASRSLQDIVHIETVEPSTVIIVFEEETNKKTQQQNWELVVNVETEKKKLVQQISKKWKQLFKLDLNVINR
eukprot:TRINITY_DN10127_c0_g1_i1.p1 TRINITY_DN10127_c0_g1~~TRINITY_DN10127_c0_g1_i1.p1  ORF type:complete len:1018 (+),score=363.99 TRINITY_DN10127_c0_g1_i1:80-3133(+)